MRRTVVWEREDCGARVASVASRLDDHGMVLISPAMLRARLVLVDADDFDLDSSRWPSSLMQTLLLSLLLFLAVALGLDE